jgi:uncharacterized protein YigA (DUF484 family)
MNEMTPGRVSNSGDPSYERVADFLRHNTDFFARFPDLLRELAPPVRWTGDTVVDLQRYMVESLQDELAGLRDCTQSVIETSRINMATQLRTHAAVLALIAAEDLAHLVRVIAGDLPIFLDVDIAGIGLEEYEEGVYAGIEGLQPLPWRMVDRLLGADQEVSLFPRFRDDGTFFGARSEAVRSAAFARLKAGDGRIDGVLALGARLDGTFEPRQGTELLRFVAQVIDLCLKRVVPVSI